MNPLPSESQVSLSQRMNEVLSLLRHELRTPINGILGYGEIILDDFEEQASTSESDNIIQTLDSIRSQGQKILTSVNSYLVATSDLEQNFEQYLEHILQQLVHEILPAVSSITADCQCLEREPLLQESQADIGKIEYSTQNLKRIVELIADVKSEPVNVLLERLNNSQAAPLPKTDSSIDIAREISTASTGEKLGFILIVDDVENNRLLFSRQLQRQGYEIDTASNGFEALEKLGQGEYDLILLDFMMPDLNGFEVLSRLKADDKLRHVPVIMISANDEIEQVIRCIEIGAEDYLPKPLNSTLLRARITSTLDKKRYRDRERDYLKQVELLSAKMTKELEMGRQMQLNFLPRKLVQHSDWEFAPFFRPARQVAGDFYDFFELPDQRVGIVIADVCDKGVGAALFMALFRSLIRIFSHQTQLRHEAKRFTFPSESWESTENLELESGMLSSVQILEAVQLTNDYVATHHGDLSMFATLFMGILNLETGHLDYINGGHEPLAIISSQGQVREKLPSTGPAVGMLPDMKFKIAQAKLDAGEALVGYTDGVPEARNNQGEFFTKDTLFELLNQPVCSGTELLETIKTQVLEFIDTAEQFDDITLVTVFRRP